MHRVGQWEAERKRGNRRSRKKKQNLLISNDRTMLAPTSRKEQDRILTSQSVVSSGAMRTSNGTPLSDTKQLADIIRSALNNDPSLFNQLQSACVRFNRREINASTFYAMASSLFAFPNGSNQFSRVFPLLVQSLPDPGLANQLQQVHLSYSTQEANKNFQGMSIQQQMPLPTKAKWGTARDSTGSNRAHIPSHARSKLSQESFPSLSTSASLNTPASATSITSAVKRFDEWNKKNPKNKTKSKGVVYLNPASKKKAKEEAKKKKKQEAKKKKAEKKAKLKTKTSILEQF